MGWKGDPCWYCGADLHQILEQEEELGLSSEEELDPRSFDWHMASWCMDQGYIQVLDGAELHIGPRADLS